MDANNNTDFLSDGALAPGQSAEALLSYIRPLINAEGEGFAVCAEDGAVLGTFDSFDEAYFTARQFRLEPQLLH